MPVNANKPERWKQDIAHSVDFYNMWFMRFAPDAYRQTRLETTQQVLAAFKQSDNLNNIAAEVLKAFPNILLIFRMATAPPLARERLVGLAGVPKSFVENMEQRNRLPPRMGIKTLDRSLDKIGNVIAELLDKDIFPWLHKGIVAPDEEVYRAATVVADRLCGAVADPIIRNAQEARQLRALGEWLNIRQYRPLERGHRVTFDLLQPGSYAFRLNIAVKQADNSGVNIPVDAVIMPHKAVSGELPLLIEAKSAGDFTNINKRRKEEAIKMLQLRHTYGLGVHYILLLCGYFDTGYLGYEAAEGIDWVWEHRLDDLEEFGL